MRFFWRKTGRSAAKWHTKAMMIDIRKTRIVIERPPKKHRNHAAPARSKKSNGARRLHNVRNPITPTRATSRMQPSLHGQIQKSSSHSECPIIAPEAAYPKSGVLSSSYIFMRSAQ